MKQILVFLFPFIFLASAPIQAQLCNGSLGDPVASASFGTGTTFGPPLQSRITNYTYASNDCPNDGFYTLASRTNACFNNSWHSLTEDHTVGDLNGKFMLVNASFSPGVFYLDTVRGLCGGTTYEFSAYIVNMLKTSACGGSGIDPNLTFTIENVDGTELVSYNTGDITETSQPVWTKYGTFFQTPSNISQVVLRIRNNAPGGCGNDIAMDDIAFRPCGPRVEASLALNGADSISLCADDTRSFVLSAIYSAGYADPRLQWQLSTDDAASWQNISGAITNTYTRNATGAGNFQYRMLVADGANITNSVCRVASEPVVFLVNPLPMPQSPDSLINCAGTMAQLSAQGGASYLWTGPGGFTSTQASPVLNNVQMSQLGQYTVQVTSSAGCMSTDATYLKVKPAVSLTVSPGTGICEGGNITLQANGALFYQWSPSTGLSSTSSPTPVASPLDSTVYQVVGFNAEGCADTASTSVAVWKKPTANAGPDLWGLNNTPLILQGRVSGTDIQWRWSPAVGLDDPALEKPTLTLTANGFLQQFTYRVNVTSNLGCGSATDDVLVTIFESFTLPNTFTPNGDGYNDTWEIRLLQAFPQALVEVYSTTGSLVFKSFGYASPWDGRQNGKTLPAGTYYYAIDLKYPGLKKLVGYVTILR